MAFFAEASCVTNKGAINCSTSSLVSRTKPRIPSEYLFLRGLILIFGIHFHCGNQFLYFHFYFIKTGFISFLKFEYFLIAHIFHYSFLLGVMLMWRVTIVYMFRSGKI